jgi:hypothetical protein
MKNVNKSKLVLIPVGLIILMALAWSLARPVLSPQGAHAAGEQAKATLASGSAVERTPLDMQRDALKPFPKPAHGVIPFRPTMNISQYKQAKAQAAAQRGPQRPGATSTTPAVTHQILSFEGAADVDGLVPPDTHGAVGKTQFVEITNSHLDIYQKSNPANHTTKSLAAFFGYFTQTLFDPRVLYDSTWNRWIVTAEAFPESSTVQRQFIAISTTASATGSFFIYNVNVTFFAGDFWDFPQVGMDQDAVIMTANIFDSSNAFKGADCFAVAKARLYNGLGFSVPVFTGLVGTLAPPVVLDQNPKTFLIAAQPSGSTLQLYSMTNTSKPAGTTLTLQANVSVPAYSVPPSAPQPGVSCPTFCLDTSDSRFINYSTQIGDVLWQVHTVAFGTATPKYYEINTATNSVIQSNFFFVSGTSSDFNASLVANSTNDMFVTWSSTDPSAGINAQVRFSTCNHTSASCAPGVGLALFTSSNPLTADFDPNFGEQRWGDYSAITVDPSKSTNAWLVNEKVNSGGDWGSRIGKIGL